MFSPVPTDSLPEMDASLWGARIRDAFFPLELDVDRNASFFAEAQMRTMPRCRIARVTASAHRVAMPAAICSRLPHRHVKVLWQVAGTSRLEHSGRSSELAPGQWTVYEATRPYDLAMSDHSAFVAFLCAVRPGDGFDYLEGMVGRRAMATEGGAAVALAAVNAVNAEGDRLSPASQEGTSDFVSALLTQEMQFLERRTEATRRRTQEALLRDARQYVRQNLECPDMSPDQIAAALHVCRRTLYHAFEAVGETPQALVQRMRLEHCREILSKGEARSANITQLAIDFGFSDPAYFARVFRRRFGLTPSQCRRATAQSAQA